MKPSSPCYNCDERMLGCHSECDLYLTYRRSLDAYNEAVRMQKNELTQVDDFRIKQIEKTRKKRSK